MATLNEPSVCAIMLTRDRPEMAWRAVECFRRQTYPAKTLVIVNSGQGPMIPEGYAPDIMEPCYVGADAQTIGELRNRGAKTASQHGADIIAHLDDDDWSHPNRIAEQVALLQGSGADCVGYNEMLFWREPRQLTNADVYGLDECLRNGIEPRCGCDAVPGEAWLYSNPNPSYVLGTSMAYWRKAWEARPFEATSQGEDVRWSAEVRCLGISAVDHPPVPTGDVRPRMIARIHGSNTSNAYRPETMARASEWRRVPEWDQHCRSVMA